MTLALLYLQLCTWRNLLLTQVRRFRKPQYLLGLVAGLLYFGFMVLQPFAPRQSRGPAADGEGRGWAMGGPGSTLEHATAAGLFLMAAFTWLLPSKRAALDFSEAEIAWLFPAPIARRTLVHFRLLRTQAGLVLSSLVVALIASGMSGAGFSTRTLVGWWVVMSALELHRQAAGFARTRLLDRGVPNWVRRLVVLALLAGLGVAVWAAFGGRWPELAEGEIITPQQWETLLADLVGTAPLNVILFPFRWVARPMVAPDFAALAQAFVPALAILGLLYLWALNTAVGFEDDTVERASSRARAVEAARSGNWHLVRERGREAKAPWALGSEGSRLAALTWKNLVSARSVLSSPAMVLIAVTLLSGLVALKLASPAAPFLKMLGAMVAGAVPMVFLVGPELARFDLRQDLPQADLLKTYPLPGWQVVLGEVLAPTVALTAFQWLMIAMAVVAFPGMGGQGPASYLARLSVGSSAVLFAPVLTLALLLLHNGTTLYFPAWVKLGPAGAQGFEAMGQRMVLMLVHFIGLLLALLAPATVGALLFLGGRLFLPSPLALPVATLAGAIVLALESALGLKLLGDRFERMDITD